MGERNAKGVSNVVRGAGAAAGETLKRAGSAARGATGAVSDVPGAEVVQGVGEKVQQAAEGAGGAVGRVGGGGRERTLGAELREIMREAAAEVLVPVARSATAQAAKYAVQHGPDLARDTIAPKLGAAIEEAGGPGAFTRDVLSSVSGGGIGILEKVRIRGEAHARPWRERPVPVEESVDVGVQLESVYDRFGQFDEYANVLSHGESVDARPNERIAWRRTDGVEADAVITFHRMGDHLTRVLVTYEHEPHGLLDRTTTIFHRESRALSADLMRFKAFAEMTEAHVEAHEEGEQHADEPQARDDEGQQAEEGHESRGD